MYSNWSIGNEIRRAGIKKGTLYLSIDQTMVFGLDFLSSSGFSFDSLDGGL